MTVVIYRENGEIIRIDDTKRFIDQGHSIKEIEAELVRYNAANLIQAEIREVQEGHEDIYRSMMQDEDFIYGYREKSIIHSVSEEVPDGINIYVFYKYEGHDILGISLTKIITKGKSNLATMHGMQGRLPIAWCYAKDMMRIIGLTKLEVKRLFKIAKVDAWTWYRDDNENK